ncbi:MAG: terminase family protein [Robiginitomaculum sp.]|nr:terminase family protein [Robiginitomaculum sp.]
MTEQELAAELQLMGGKIITHHIKKLSAWHKTRRPDQEPPKGKWLIWILLGGRGAGKTRAGAEWVREQVMDNNKKRIALVAPTYNDAREVMIGGESGLLNIGPEKDRPKYISSRRRLEWKDGAVAYVFSAEDPDGLRGPQFDCAWADEFCAWSYPDDTLSNLRLGLRLGDEPQLVITTTPKPLPTLKKLMLEPGMKVTRATTKDNAANLSPAFMQSVYEIYGGTRLGRQELNGEIIEDREGALWTRALIDSVRVDAAPEEIQKTVVAIDPPATSGSQADACGLIVATRVGFGAQARVYILHDATVQGLKPDKWAALAVKLWQQWDADYLLAEINQGGDMVKTMLDAIGEQAPVRTVYASKSKVARAEPVAALYEQGKVKHAGSFTQLEDELCMMGAHGNLRKSPDRADALVWAVTDLLLKPRIHPQVRMI